MEFNVAWVIDAETETLGKPRLTDVVGPLDKLGNPTSWGRREVYLANNCVINAYKNARGEIERLRILGEKSKVESLCSEMDKPTEMEKLDRLSDADRKYFSGKIKPKTYERRKIEEDKALEVEKPQTTSWT